MFFASDRLSVATRNGFDLVARPGPLIINGMIAAAAEMALADGHVDPVEHRGLLAFLKRANILVLLGRGMVFERFTAEVKRVAKRHEVNPDQAQKNERDDWQDLTTRLRPLADMESAPIIAGAAACVAAADGMVHPREVRLLRSLREILGSGHFAQA